LIGKPYTFIKKLEYERGGVGTEVMPIVKVDVHAPIFYFPKNIKRVGEHAKLIT
jgi:hypothetical protein